MQKILSQNNNVKTFGILLLVAVITAFIGGSGFIGWPLNASEMDYLLFPTILENRASFEGTVYLTLAEQVSKLSVLPRLSMALTALGINPTTQITLLFTLEKFIYSLGLLAICFILSRSLQTTILCFAIFVISGLSWIFYLKLITSSLAVAIGFGIIALAISGHFALAGALAAGVGYLHPTYLPVYLSLVLIIQAYAVSQGKSSFASFWKTGIIALAVSVPFILNIVSSLDSVLGQIFDERLWFSYMQNRSDLAFPWRHGLPRLLSFTLLFASAAWLFFKEAKRERKNVYGYLGIIAVAAIIAYPIQIIFTEVVPIAFVAKLALTHRFNFVIEPLLMLGILLIASDRMRGNQRWPWTLLIIFFTVSSRFPQWSVVPKYLPNARDLNIDLLVMTLAALFLVMFSHPVEDRSSILKHRLLGGFAFFMTVSSLVLFVNPSFLLLFCSLVLALPFNKPVLLNRLQSKLGQLGPRTCYGLVLAVITLVFLLKINTLDSMRAWLAFFRNDTQALNKPEMKYIDFVTAHVKPDEHLLIVPLRLQPPVPYRATYLDWNEINYVLYAWDMMPMVLEKIKSYGINPFEAQDKGECNGWKGLLQYRCQRFILDRKVGNETSAWRSHVVDILRIDPMVRWALMPQNLSCKNDLAIANFQDLVLVDIKQIDVSCGQ